MKKASVMFGLLFCFIVGVANVAQAQRYQFRDGSNVVIASMTDTGDLHAPNFIGDGSALTNLPAGGVTESQNPVSWTGAHTWVASGTVLGEFLFDENASVQINTNVLVDGPEGRFSFNDSGLNGYGSVDAPLIILDAQGSGVGPYTNGEADFLFSADGVLAAVMSGTGTVFNGIVDATSFQGDGSALSGTGVKAGDNPSWTGSHQWTTGGASQLLSISGLIDINDTGRITFNQDEDNDYGSPSSPLIDLDFEQAGVGFATNGAADILLIADGATIGVVSSTGATFVGNVDAATFTGDGSALTGIISGVSESQNPVSWTGAHTFVASTTFNSSVLIPGSSSLQIKQSAINFDDSKLRFNNLASDEHGVAGDPNINLDVQGSGVGFYTNGGDDILFSADGVEVAVMSGTGTVIPGILTVKGDSINRGVIDKGGFTTANLAAAACSEFVTGVTICKYFDLDSQDMFLSTGSAANQSRNSRTGTGPQ